MEKSVVTEFFVKYFEDNKIEKQWISDKTGIDEQKLTRNYKEALTAEEFLHLCALLSVQPEEVLAAIKDTNA